MPEIPDAAYVILYIAPGLLLVQMLRTGGIGRGLSGLDRFSIGVVAGVVIRLIGSPLAGQLDLGLDPALEVEIAMLGLGLALGVLQRGFVYLFGSGDEDEEEAPPLPRRPRPAAQPEQKAEESPEEVA